MIKKYHISYFADKINIVSKYKIYLKLIHQYPSMFILIFTNLVLFTVTLSKNSIKKII